MSTVGPPYLRMWNLQILRVGCIHCTTSFYIRDLSIHRAWNPRRVLERVPQGHPGVTVIDACYLALAPACCWPGAQSCPSPGSGHTLDSGICKLLILWLYFLCMGVLRLCLPSKRPVGFTSPKWELDAEEATGHPCVGGFCHLFQLVTICIFFLSFFLSLFLSLSLVFLSGRYGSSLLCAVFL